MRAIALLKPKVNVIAAIPFSREHAERLGASGPGDVLRHRGGKTSEVLNTDAEGRLVLADALAYLAEKKPAADHRLGDAHRRGMVALGEDMSARVRQRRHADRATPRGRRGRRRAGLGAAAVARIPEEDRVARRRREEHRRPLRRRHHRRAVPGRVRRRHAVGAPGRRGPAFVEGRRRPGPRGATGVAGARRCPVRRGPRRS